MPGADRARRAEHGCRRGAERVAGQGPQAEAAEGNEAERGDGHRWRAASPRPAPSTSELTTMPMTSAGLSLVPNRATASSFNDAGEAVDELACRRRSPATGPSPRGRRPTRRQRARTGATRRSSRRRRPDRERRAATVGAGRHLSMSSLTPMIDNPPTRCSISGETISKLRRRPHAAPRRPPVRSGAWLRGLRPRCSWSTTSRWSARWWRGTSSATACACTSWATATRRIRVARRAPARPRRARRDAPRRRRAVDAAAPPCRGRRPGHPAHRAHRGDRPGARARAGRRRLRRQAVLARELAVRVRNVLRRGSTARAAPPTVDAPCCAFGPLDIDPAAREVAVDGRVVALTPKEFDLLAVLAGSPRQVFSRRQLLGPGVGLGAGVPGPGHGDGARRPAAPEDANATPSTRAGSSRRGASATGSSREPLRRASLATRIADRPLRRRSPSSSLGRRRRRRRAACCVALTARTRSLRQLVLAITLVVARHRRGRRRAARPADGARRRPGCARRVGVLAATAVFATRARRSWRRRRSAATPAGWRRRCASSRRATGPCAPGVDRADELGHVARALDELTERLDVLERERAGFEDERRAMLTSVGHDLRTPLGALRAAVEALADGVAPDPAAVPAGDAARRRGARRARRRLVPARPHRVRAARARTASRSTSPSSPTRRSRRWRRRRRRGASPLDLRCDRAGTRSTATRPLSAG